MTFRITIHRKITWLLLFSIFSLAMASRLIYVSERNIERTNFSIGQTWEAIYITQQLLTDFSTPPPSYLQMTGELDSLHLADLALENNDQQQHVASLRALMLNPNAANFQAARLLLDSMMKEEKVLLARQKNTNDTIDRRVAYGLVIARFAGFILVFIILVQLNKEFTRRKQTQELLVDAIREAHEAKQMQEQFLANMSHEIRTPMNGIKGMTDLLMDTPLSIKQHELTGIIKSSVNNLLVIINDILDFSKIKAGKLNIEKIDFSLKETLTGSTAIFEHRLKKKGLRLDLDMDPSIPDRLKGDPHRLNQILINLIGNAIKFTDHGQIGVTIAMQQRSDSQVTLSFAVSDTGIGIPPDSLPFIFDSFCSGGRGHIAALWWDRAGAFMPSANS